MKHFTLLSLLLFAAIGASCQKGTSENAGSSNSSTDDVAYAPGIYAVKSDGSEAVLKVYLGREHQLKCSLGDWEGGAWQNSAKPAALSISIKDGQLHVGNFSQKLDKSIINGLTFDANFDQADQPAIHAKIGNNAQGIPFVVSVVEMSEGQKNEAKQ